MHRTILKSLLGCINSILYLVATFLVAISIIIGGFIIWIIPFKWWRHHATRILLIFPVLWFSALNSIAALSTHKKWDIQGDNSALSTDNWYMLISNHQTWLDILVLGYVFNRKIPITKFFMKKELLWTLPLAGLSCWILGYPIMARHTRKEIRKNPELKGKDIETTKKACQKFKEFPTTIMTFAEGTRFSKEKCERQKSPYQHLLKPKAGGLAMVVGEMHDKLSGIINVTLQYDINSPMTFWKFATADFRKIKVHYELLPITDDLIGDYYNDRLFRKRFQHWLNDVWERKDQQLNQ